MTADVLIVHNAADGTDTEQFAESNAGVLEEVDAVVAALEKLDIRYKVTSIRSIAELPAVLSAASGRIIFNLVEELPQNIKDACYVPAVCRAYGRPCTGSDTSALLLAQNKWQAKAILRAHNIPTPDSAIIPCGRKPRRGELAKGTYLVKPAFSDASEGIDEHSIVDAPGDSLNNAVAQVHERFAQPALVEQFIPNRELNVSVFEESGHVRVLAVAEIDFSAFGANKPRIVGYSAKWLTDSFEYNNTPRIIPAPLSKEADALVRQYALDAWKALGCADYIRVDFRMDDKEQPFVIEVNPNPDLCPGDGFAAALEVAGISYDQFVRTILGNAAARQSQGGPSGA